MALNVFELSSLVEFKEVESTNQKALEYVQKNQKENVLLISATQTNGRGRFNRRWESPPGGLYLSLILKPSISQEYHPLFPLLSSLAVAETINEYSVPCSIKWPNDVLVNGKKIAGVLIESHTIAADQYIIVGMGINLNTTCSQYTVELRKTLTTLIEELQKEIDRTDFLAKLLKHFNHYFTLFEQKNTKKITDTWRKYSDTLGRQVKILASQQEIIGTAVNIDSTGFLLVKTASGEQKKIMSGDCLYIDTL